MGPDQTSSGKRRHLRSYGEDAEDSSPRPSAAEFEGALPETTSAATLGRPLSLSAVLKKKEKTREERWSARMERSHRDGPRKSAPRCLHPRAICPTHTRLSTNSGAGRRERARRKTGEAFLRGEGQGLHLLPAPSQQELEAREEGGPATLAPGSRVTSK